MKSIVLYQHEVTAVLGASRKVLVLRPIKFRHPAAPPDLPPCDLVSFDGLEVQFKDKISWMVPIKCPYGRAGDLLWAKEAWRTWGGLDHLGPSKIYNTAVWYKDGMVVRNDFLGKPGKWRPSITMPQWASRITLRVTGVKVKRVKDVTVGEMRAMGVEYGPCRPGEFAIQHTIREWENLWNKMNKKRGYGLEVNPWVWAITAVMEEK